VLHPKSSPEKSMALNVFFIIYAWRNEEKSRHDENMSQEWLKVTWD
jgi:hypothetical protein